MLPYIIGGIWFIGSITIFILAYISKRFYEFIDRHPFCDECASCWIIFWPGCILFTIVEMCICGPSEILKQS